MTSPRYYPALDGLRGVAAFCVVVMHRDAWFGLDGWLVHGYLAVDFFFMLSGFVIANAYEHKLAQGMSTAAFMRARLIRLQPLVLLGATIAAIWKLYAHHIGVSPATPGQIALLYGSIALLVPALWDNGVGNGVYPLDPPTWSLFFELAVNLAYALLAPFLPTRRLAICTGLAFIALIFLSLAHHGVDAGGTTNVFWGGFVRVTFPFLTGVLIYRLRAHPTFARLRAPFLVQAAILLAVLNVPGLGAKGAWFDLACLGVVFPLLLISGAMGEASARQATIMKRMGELSYPIYVLHYPIYVALGGIGVRFLHLTEDRMLPYGLFVLAVIMVASVVSIPLYDKPVRAWLTRVTSRGRTA